MAKPATNKPPLTAARLWQLVTERAPGRGGNALRVAAACTTTVLVGEIWQVPDIAVPALVTMALWQKDRVTNVLAGLAVNILFGVIILMMFGLMHLTLDHPMGLVIATAVLSFGFFFLGSASKLKPVAYMLGLVVVYAMIAIGNVPIGELATRALLYADLFILVPGAVMVCLAPFICPSPKTILTRTLANHLRLSAALLRSPEDEQTRDQAEALLRDGTKGMIMSLKMAGLEKLWRKQDLASLQQAILRSVGVLAVAHAAACEATDAPDIHSEAPEALIETLLEIADIFQSGGYPTDIAQPPMPHTPPALTQLAALLPDFTKPAEEGASEKSKSKSSSSGFFAPDAWTNPEHVRFAVKGTAAVMLSYFIFKILNWDGIHTCIITCFIVALPTMGEMISKLTLRISGALVGGALGILSIIFVMPHLTNIAAFLVLIFAGSLLAAWVKSGDERIAYAGFQIGLAFFLSDLKGYGPTSDMTTARDRIIGILLGNFITYAVFTSFWPSSAYDKIRDKVSTALKALQAQFNASSVQAELQQAAAVQSALAQAERMIEFASVEPIHLRANMDELATYQAITSQISCLTEDGLIPARRTAASAQLASLDKVVS
ncbi:fusaric acid resistance protein [Acetobacter malorum DSM 14337]|uniref:Fusaric acid resistance protein n=1 Tax=Acetobacter malorum DSM 14337 TaxID=1307910 RepID=A0ABQ0PPH4_9PROT|nr:FUSC family protein [Acetobacter malorum]KXV09210.1 fusaric acid resistance protein [Acetobacter malorum]GBQ77442.1 fusaric acid resistance protein [Acetobacter malorum DSM 14337]